MSLQPVTYNHLFETLQNEDLEKMKNLLLADIARMLDEIRTKREELNPAYYAWMQKGVKPRGYIKYCYTLEEYFGRYFAAYHSDVLEPQAPNLLGLIVASGFVESVPQTWGAIRRKCDFYGYTATVNREDIVPDYMKGVVSYNFNFEDFAVNQIKLEIDRLYSNSANRASPVVPGYVDAEIPHPWRIHKLEAMNWNSSQLRDEIMPTKPEESSIAYDNRVLHYIRELVIETHTAFMILYRTNIAYGHSTTLIL